MERLQIIKAENAGNLNNRELKHRLGQELGFDFPS